MRNGMVTALLFSVLAGSTAHDTAWGQVTRRVSVASDESQGASHSRSYPGSISSDGRYVAFSSQASNLVAGDSNSAHDIFVRDRLLGTTTRVSVSSLGAQANASSYACAISKDGRFVAFSSAASSLVAGDTNGNQDVFVHDRVTGTTSRVSVATGGAQASTTPIPPDNVLPVSISADGRHVAFTSDLIGLVPGDTNNHRDIFVHDRNLLTTTRVNVTSTGVQANGASIVATISQDGRYVLFDSNATNLESGDINAHSDYFLHDRDFDADGVFDETHAGARRTTLVSRGSLGERGDNISGFDVPAMTADAQTFLFTSFASNLVPGDTNNDGDVFLRTALGATSRVSLSWLGQELTLGAFTGDISPSGRYVAFQSFSPGVMPGVHPASYDNQIFVRDLTTSVMYHATPTMPSTYSDNGSSTAAFTADGRTLAYWSDSEGLILADSNIRDDVFVRTLGPDGTADWECAQVAVQDTQTSLGDNTLGDVTNANGSELDAAYASIEGGYLLLTLSGNVDLSTAALHVFLDSQPGGQNRLRSNNPVIGANNALVRMGDSGSGNGFRFDAGFEADYYLALTGAAPGTVSFATLPTAGAGIARVLGTVDVLSPGRLTTDNPDGILCTYNNSTTAGVTAGTASSVGTGVRTGVEFAIPLAAIGSPECGIRVSAFLTNSTFSSVSNQVLGPLGGRAALGEPRNVNLGSISRNQFFEAVPQLGSYAALGTPAPQDQANFGRAIAVRSGQALIGARRFDRPGANDAGAIFTSAKVGGTWTAPVEVVPSTLPAAGDRLGWSIAYDQNWAFVGAPNRDSAGADAGAVWVFERTATNTWVQRAILTAPDAQAGANFGYSVDLSFDRAIVGAPNHDGVGVDSGKAYVYGRTSSGWALQAQLTATDGAAGDQFGFDVATSLLGTEVVVGAPGDDRAALTNAGAAYMFRRSGSSWPSAFHRRWEASDAISNQRFGSVVALSTAFAAIGAPDTGTGAVYPIFKTGSTWNSAHGSKITPSDGVTGDLFGFSLAATNTQLVVGAPNSGQPFFDCGILYAYGYGSGTLYPTAKITAPDAAAGDALGGDVAIDGTTVAAGAGGIDPGGGAYTFDLAAAAPIVTEIPADGTHPLGSLITLTWQVSLPSPGTARVYRDGVLLQTTPLASAGLASVDYTLYVVPSTSGVYWMEVETTCQSTQSPPTTITSGPGPTNDDCSGAILLQPGDLLTASTSFATSDASVRPLRAGGVGGAYSAPGVWYRFVGTGGRMRASTCHPLTAYDTVLELFCDNQCTGSYYSLLFNDDVGASCGPSWDEGLRSSLEFCTVPGNSYLLFVGGFGFTSGTYQLSLSNVPEACTGAEPTFHCSPRGACCTTGACQTTSQSTCASISGSWGGAHTLRVQTSTQIYTRNPSIVVTGGAVTTDSLLVPDSFDFSAISLSLDIQGDVNAGGLLVRLRKGLQNVLVWNAFCRTDGLTATFRDSGISALPCPASLVTDPVLPKQPLDFSGESSSGAWTLEIDNNNLPGLLASWSLSFDRITSTASPCSCHGSCVADFDDGSGTGTPDEGVTIDDLLYYLQIFEIGELCADVDDGSFTGTTDNGVTIDDLLYYLARFESGC